MKTLQIIIAACSLLLMLSAGKIQNQQPYVRIEHYHNGNRIACISRVPIKTNFPKNRINHMYLIVHPLKVAQSWVQQECINDSNDVWYCNAQIGQSPSTSNGDTFDIIVLINPRERLVHGQQLMDLPQSELHSPTVTLIKWH